MKLRDEICREWLTVGDGETGNVIDFNVGYTSQNTGIIRY